MNAAIAQHLNVAESAIVRIEEWAHVLFVVCKKIGARFVSKKVVQVENTNLTVVKKGYATEWMDAENLFQSQIMVQRHKNGGGKFSASYKNGTRLASIGSFETLEMAVSAAWKARKQYLIDEKKDQAAKDRAFAIASGMVQTSSGKWVDEDECQAAQEQGIDL